MHSPWMYFSDNLFPARKHALVSPSFSPANEKISLQVFSDCQPISAVQSSPVYARDRSRSSLAIQLSCWTQAFIFSASVWEDSVPELWGQVLLATTLQCHTEAMPGLPSLGKKRWAHPLPLATISPGAWHRYTPPCLSAP